MGDHVANAVAEAEEPDDGHTGEADDGRTDVALRPGGERPGPAEQVGLALRAFRREHGLSQRALADRWGLCQALVARVERRAGELSMDTSLALLARAGMTMAVLDGEGMPVVDWEPTDLAATDRGGRRFPAHRTVRASPHGPTWWWFHEYFGRRADGPQPRWTAAGFPAPEGTRYGKEPRPYDPDEGPRWPYG